MKAWKGPISIAVFSPDRDAVSAMFGIQILRKCNADIRRHVTFHIMYPSSHPPRFDETVEDFTDEECSIGTGWMFYCCINEGKIIFQLFDAVTIFNASLKISIH